MLVIDNLPTIDTYSRELTLESQFGGRLVYLVANQSAVAQFRPLVERGGTEAAAYGPDVLLAPQSSFIDKISGVRFRSAVPGSPARVVAQLSEPGDILPASGTPFTATLSAGGGVTGLVSAYARVGRPGANQVIASGVSTAISFTVEDLDLDNMWDAAAPTQLTVRTAGKYLLSASVRWQANNAGLYQVSIVKNGTGFGAWTINPNVVGFYDATIGAILLECAVNDALTLVAFQNTGVAQSIIAATGNFPYFMAVRIAD